MSNGNGEAVTTEAQSRVAGPVGDISKLLQRDAPDALGALPEPEHTAPEPARNVQEQLDQADAVDAAAQPAPDEVDHEPDAPETSHELAREDKPHDVEVDVAGLSIADIAERLGVDAKTLYKDLQIPMPDDAPPASLGQLKDMVRGVATLEADRATLTEDRDAHRDDVLASKQELGGAVEVITGALVARFGQDEGRAILDEAVKVASRGQVERKAINTKRFFERFPEAKDPTVRAEMRERMIAHLAPDFTPHDVDQIDDVATLAYIHRNMLRDEKIEAARAKIEKRAPASDRAPAARTRKAPRAERTKQQLVKRAKATGERGDVLAGVSAILQASSKRK